MIDLTYSIEVLPGKTQQEIQQLYLNINQLKLSPDFITVAALGYINYTRDTVLYLAERLSIDIIPHIAAQQVTVDTLPNLLEVFYTANIKRLLLVSGDRKNSGKMLSAIDNVVDLLSQIESIHPNHFEYIMACDCYQQNPQNQQYLIKKNKLGCRQFISQLIVDPRIYDDFLSNMQPMSASLCIIPGIAITQHIDQLIQLLEYCGISINNEKIQQLSYASEESAATYRRQISTDANYLFDKYHRIHFFSFNRFSSLNLILADFTV